MSGETTSIGLICGDERRRHQVRASDYNGLDYLEVSDDQLTLTLYFLGKAPESIRPENVRIEGGRRVRDLRVVDLRLCIEDDPDQDDCMHVRVDRPGDFSTYRICVVEVDEKGEPTGRPYPGFDPRYHCLDFSFKVGCPSELDCKGGEECPEETRVEPDINYLAKDYASFRQLILDRLSLVLPGWRERHVPDVGIALVELLAYAGDHLSYYQDAVATEAYLDTARRRISVRRHVRLVDYAMHDGCNARAWVCLNTDQDSPADLKAGEIWFVTRWTGAGYEPGLVPADELRNVPPERYEVFLPVADPAAPLVFRAAHSKLLFYTWGDGECCLPKGATSATLRDTWLDPEPVEKETEEYEHCEPEEPPAERGRALNLAEGDVLIFEEVIGPRTGNPADADPSHRHAVRLTAVRRDVDALYGVPVVEIEWAAEDALPFPLCLSTLGPDCERLEDVSVAWGNVLLVDHGILVGEDLGSVTAEESEPCCVGEGRRAEVPLLAKRFRPVLKKGPLVFREPLEEGASATRLLSQDPRRAVPQITLSGTPAPESPWTAQRDLLASGPSDFHFVVETDDEGRGHLRFGDGELGRRLEAGTAFQAVYRIGGGPSGNVGPESIVYAVAGTLSGISLRPRNPLPARGGTAPEPLAEVKLLAPHAFRSELRRAVAAEDYARIVEREFPDRVQRAAATLRWTGSGPEVLVAVDLKGGGEDEALLGEIERALEPYRRIGHDVVVRRAEHVPLAVTLVVCVRPSYLRGHVRAAVLEALGKLFHPDALSFGDGIAASRLIAAAQAVTGVENVRLTQLERLHEGPGTELEDGFLPLGPMEVARLDNDPRYPENGQLQLDMRGGR
jgi:hypothetical protein